MLLFIDNFTMIGFINYKIQFFIFDNIKYNIKIILQILIN